MRLRIALFWAALAVAAQGQATFKAGTRLVEVDVVVRDKNGPVTGLTKGDFTLLDEGKPREISVFTVTAARTSARTSPQPALSVAPGTVSNRPNGPGEAPASATILLIDRLNTPLDNQNYANRKIVQFLQAHGNKDRIAIYTMGSSLRVIQDLTDDPDRLDRAVKRLKPQDAKRLSADVQVDPTGDATTDAMVARGLEALEDFVVKDHVQLTKQALMAIARHLSKVPGRKNLIWVSGSFPLLILRAHETINFSQDVDEASRALSDANVAVYPVDARGLIGMTTGTAEQGGTSQGNCARPGGPCVMAGPQGGPSGVDTMNTLAALTGGRAFYNTNGLEDSMQRAAEDAALTYTLGFTLAENAFDEKFHKLAVKVNRKGVDLRFRNGYFAARTASPLTLNELLQDSLDAVGVGMVVEATRDSGQPGVYRVHAVVDLHDIHLEHQGSTWQGTVDFSTFIQGSKAFRTITKKIEIPEDQLALALEKGFEINDTISAEGPAAELRVIAQDRATGTAGSVLIPLGKQ